MIYALLISAAAIALSAYTLIQARATNEKLAETFRLRAEQERKRQVALVDAAIAARRFKGAV